MSNKAKSVQRPKNIQDILPQDTHIWQYMEKAARDLCRRYGFHEIRTPIFEHTELFHRGVGDTTDIVEKEMYTFLDRGDRSISLRPEGTAGVVRAFVENKLHGAADAQKLFYIGPMFRYERAQAGRTRQFHQFGVEVFGSTDPATDAEVIALGHSFFSSVGLRNVRVEINSLGTPDCRIQYRSALQQYLKPMLTTLCDDCQSRFERNPMRILDCKVDGHLFANAPSILDYLDEDSRQHFEQVKASLSAMGIPYQVDKRMVRGLDYYTHTAFEYKAEGIGSIDTIGGGGRYNGLVEDLGGPATPGIGIGIGLERTLLLLEHQNIAVPLPESPVMFVIPMGDDARSIAAKLIYDLRTSGHFVSWDNLARSIKAQFKAAERSGAVYAAIIGNEEIKQNVVSVKRLSDGSQEMVKLTAIAAYLTGKQD